MVVLLLPLYVHRAHGINCECSCSLHLEVEREAVQRAQRRREARATVQQYVQIIGSITISEMPIITLFWNVSINAIFKLKISSVYEHSENIQRVRC